MARIAAGYVLAVHELSGAAGARVATGRLARRLGIANSTASVMLQKLAEDGLLDYLPYQGVCLTAAGRELARRAIRRQQLVRRFLEQVLALPEEELTREADRLEPCLSDGLAERIDQFLHGESSRSELPSSPDARARENRRTG
ncbi:MAG: metal-dependent transcriptional regulator [Planctomycetales bacterium]